MASSMGSERDTLEKEIDIRMGKISAHEEEITGLATEVAGLKSRLNAVLPIAKLPAEVLSEIFLINTILISRRSLHWWIPLLHVCVKWRQVALGCAKLWTVIEQAHPDLLKTALKLSGHLPLTVKLRVRPKDDQLEAYKLIMPHLVRFRTASFRVTQDTQVYIDTQRANSEAPLLEELDLSVKRGVSTLPGILTMSLPRLSRLIVKGGDFAVLQSFIRPTITSLTLNSHRSLPNELAEVFSALPDLRRLTLHNVAQDPPEFQLDQLPPPSRTVSLPQLTWVHMMEDFRNGLSHAYLLDHLILPKNASIRFIARGACTRQSCDVVLASINAKLPFASMQPRTISVNTSLKLNIWTERVSLDDLDWPVASCRAPLVLKLAADTLTMGEGILLDVLSGIDLSEVTTLSVESPLHVPTWLAFVQRMVKLEELVLSGGALDVGFVAGVVQCSVENPSTPVLPLFNVLKVSSPKMKKHPLRPGPDDLMFTLVILLTLRKDAGAPLDRLIFSAPINMMDKDYDVLEATGGAKEIIRDEQLEESWSECSSDDEEDQGDEPDADDSEEEDAIGDDV